MRPGRLFATLFLMACLAQSSNAQSLTPNELADMGVSQYESYDFSDIDTVNLRTGALMVNIPLTSYPQRGGKFKLNFVLRYNYTGLYDYLAPAAGAGFQGGFDIVETGLPLYSAGCEPNPSNVMICTASLTMPDGSGHPLAGVSGTGATATSFRSIDASGYRIDITQIPTGPPWATPYTLFEPDGTRHSFNPNASAGATVSEDSNGNQITSAPTWTDPSNGNPSASGPWTDTMGRQLPTPFTWPYGSQGYGNTTDFGGCSGPLPIAVADVWNLPGVNGGNYPLKFCFASISESIPIPTLLGTTYQTVPVLQLQSLVLPNGTAWTFQYSSDGNGLLTQITYPTGGTVSYSWTASPNMAACIGVGVYGEACNPLRAIATRTLAGGAGPSGTQAYSYASGSPLTTTVTDPLGNATVHAFGYSGYLAGQYETQTTFYQGPVSAGMVLKTINADYKSFLGPNFTGNASWVSVVPIRRTTIWPNGKQSKVENDYDPGFAAWGILGNGTPDGSQVAITPYGNIVATREYDYGQGALGALLRTTNTNYLAFSNSSYLANNLVDTVSSRQVLDAGGTQRAYTTYGYDASPSPSGVHGNQTSVSRWLNTTGTYLTSTAVYNTNGTVASTTDPKLNTTSYGYSSGYAGSGPTSVTNALNQTTSHTYDFNTGLLASTTDPNSRITSYTYDMLWRLATATYPDGGEDIITHQETTFPFSATFEKLVVAGLQATITTDIFDGLGRTSQSQLTDTEGTDYSVRTYDADGRVSIVYNPTRCNPPTTKCTTNGEVSWGFTTTLYDGLNRTIQVTKQDGSIVTTAYCGSSTLVTDESGHWRRSTTDGLGRPIEADEPNSTTATVNSMGCPASGDPIWVTTYTYDTLDDLLSVTQGGSHGRSFAFDSQKRLTSSLNPETGTTPVTYTYDADGNVFTKSDARGITTTYSYDTINRLTGRTYSNGDPSVTYTYDQATCIGVSPCYNIGRRTSMTDAAGSESLSYDSMGRELGELRTTNGISRTTQYSYNLDGTLATLTYPSGRVITYTTTNTGWPAKAVDVADNVTYVDAHGCNWGRNTDGVCHTPWGAVTSGTLGYSGPILLYFTHQFNPRLQLKDFSYYLPGDPDAVYVKLVSYIYTDANGHNNGNIWGITNSLDATRSQTFTYDQVNRITSGGTNTGCGANCWGLTFTNDQWGNLTTAAATGSATPLNLTINASNRITTSGFTYDASGNLTADLTSAYVWNAESEIKCAGGMTYLYDGDGNRVEKETTCTAPGPSKIYWYGAGTEILEETDATGSLTNTNFFEYIYFDGKRVARRDSSGNVLYYMQDDLGTTAGMLEINAAQTTETVCYDADFYPYGGEKVFTNTCAQNYKFEGKERDTETGNDDFGARYYSSVYGRWLSPDWSSIPAPVPYANLNNPQTLNLYAMVADNPETFADLDGHCGEDLCVVEGATAIYVGGAALLAGTAAVLNTPSGQRSLSTFTSAAGRSISDSIGAIKSFFSKNTPAPQSNPASGAQTGTQAGTQPKDVYIDPSKYPASAGHVADAQAAGHPDVLTVDRTGASDRRAAATAGTATQSGTDRDEYPPAVTTQGGTGASVKKIPSSDNRGSGASLGNQISDVPNGGQIRVIPQPPPPKSPQSH